MTRRELREHIAQMLFVIEFHEREDIKEQALGYIESLNESRVEDCSEKDRDYMLTKLDNIVDAVGEIDKVIEEASVGWQLKRMNKVDLTVLRLAVYEIRYDEEKNRFYHATFIDKSRINCRHMKWINQNLTLTIARVSQHCF